MRASIGVAVLLVPVLVLGGGVAALAATTDEYEQRRVVAEGYDDALAAAAEVRESARLSLDRYLSLAADAKAALATVSSLQSSQSGLLDVATVAALTPLGEAVTDALPDPGPTLKARPPVVHASDPEALVAAADELERWTVELRDEWSTREVTIAEVDGAVRRLRTGIMAVAGSVAATGKSILDASGSASAETRAALSAALTHVSSHIEDGTDPSADLAVYLDAAQSVQESHAAAVAAAASSSATGSDRSAAPRRLLPFPFGPGTDPNNPPQVYFSGAYVGPSCDWGAAANLVSATLANGDVYYFSSDVPYEGRLLDGSIQWYLVINACATGP